jgi:hypothetical protein
VSGPPFLSGVPGGPFQLPPRESFAGLQAPGSQWIPAGPINFPPGVGFLTNPLAPGAPNVAPPAELFGQFSPILSAPHYSPFASPHPGSAQPTYTAISVTEGAIVRAPVLDQPFPFTLTPQKAPISPIGSPGQAATEPPTPAAGPPPPPPTPAVLPPRVDSVTLATETPDVSIAPLATASDRDRQMSVASSTTDDGWIKLKNDEVRAEMMLQERTGQSSRASLIAEAEDAPRQDHAPEPASETILAPAIVAVLEEVPATVLATLPAPVPAPAPAPAPAPVAFISAKPKEEPKTPPRRKHRSRKGRKAKAAKTKSPQGKGKPPASPKRSPKAVSKPTPPKRAAPIAQRTTPPRAPPSPVHRPPPSPSNRAPATPVNHPPPSPVHRPPPSPANKAASGQLHAQLGMELKTESRRIFQNGVPMQDTFLCVHAVLPAGPCYQAGIRAGDVIVAWAGQRLTSKAQWAEKVAITTPGDVVSLTLYTSGDSCRNVHVTVGGTTRPIAHKPATAKPGAPKPAAAAKGIVDDDEGILGW